jgi:hypothetical protein
MRISLRSPTEPVEAWAQRIRGHGTTPRLYATRFGAEQAQQKHASLGHRLSIITPGFLYIFRTPREETDVVFKVDTLADGKVRPVSATVESVDGSEISATDWRAVNIQQLWRDHVVGIVNLNESDDETDVWDDGAEMLIHNSAADSYTSHVSRMGIAPRAVELELMRAKGPVRDTLEHVASVYMLGEVIGLPPVKLVQEAFATEEQGPLPRATATKWVRRARESGLIEDPLSDATEGSSDG